MRRFAVVIVGLVLGVAPATAGATTVHFGPGAPGIGDPYFPLDGNGGYDVAHYDLDISYEPATDVLRGVATIQATAKQDLSSFNLDLEGLTVRSISVDGRSARWTRNGGELTITPRSGLRKRSEFTTVIAYDGVPLTIGDAEIGLSGFIHTDDGTLVAGQPDVAANWYPVNDHPLDKASYTFRITVPRGLQAIANGELENVDERGRWVTWEWDAREPMASYLATATIGEFDIKAYRADGIKFLDAIDPDLLESPKPHSGKQFAISQIGEPSYKRLLHKLTVPARGARLSFWIARDTEPAWDNVFIEAHTVGADDWTTLPDANGHTSQDPGAACVETGLHPFLEHYVSPDADGACTPKGSTGVWWAASGESDGYELWSVDLSAYANKTIEVALSHVSDDLYQYAGVEVDDISVSTGQGSTSFERDNDPFDGWTIAGAPDGSAPNPNDWILGNASNTPLTRGQAAAADFKREPEILRFLAGLFGPYPFSAAGGIVDDADGLGFALENQTRPIYSKVFWDVRSEPTDSVVVHELAHQWTGDSLALSAWKHIWLNEGFASYTEWLWSEREGRATAQDYFDFYAGTPADDPFWSLTIGDPGPDLLFEIPVYDRGAMTLHALRLQIGDPAFFRLLREWVRSNTGGNVAIPQFIALAERISHQDLDGFFNTWLFTPAKPAGLDSAAARVAPLSAVQDVRARERVAGVFHDR
jgi:hypothetical protein